MSRSTPPVPSAAPPWRAIALAILVIVVAVAIILLLPRSGPTDPAPGSPSTHPSGSPGASVVPSVSPDGSGDPSPSAPPSPTAGSAEVLVGAGDIGDCDTQDDSGTATLFDAIEGTVFTAGDNAYRSGKVQEFATCFDETWGRHRDRIRPAPGNHDWRTADLAGYFGYFGAAAQGPGGTPWYAYDLGTWHVIVLDSECDKTGGCGPDSAQGQWLAADLAASTSRCTAAIWHHPRFSSGDHGNDRDVAPFWTAMHAAGVDVVVNGHDHDYERFGPQDPDGNADAATGIREFVVGTGGTELRPFVDTKANSELRILDHGVLILTLRDGGYDWEFRSTANEALDRGSGACH